MIRPVLAVSAVLALGLGGTAAFAQSPIVAEAPLVAQIPLPPPTAPPPLLIPPLTPPVDPQRLQLPQRPPLLITPSITVTEQYNDNINLDNRNRRWDVITGFTPALTAIFERPTYRLAAGYSFTAELYWRDTTRNRVFDRQAFNLESLWRPTERWTLNLSDAFLMDTNTNLVATDNVATGRNRAWGNVVTPATSYRLTEFTTVRAFGSYSVLRYDDARLINSDTYRADVALDRRLTPTLTGTLEYQFAYFDIVRQQKTWAHTPRLGAQWQPTPTVTLSVNGGPSFQEYEDGRSRITPAVTASYRQRFSWGALGVSYDRAIGTAGGLGGTTDNQSVAASAEYLTLMKGLVLTLAPRYSTVKSPDGRIDQNDFIVGLGARYRLTAWMSAIAAYTFFRQRVASTIPDLNGNPLARDADQNRIWAGFTFGYPIRFD